MEEKDRKFIRRVGIGSRIAAGLAGLACAAWYIDSTYFHKLNLNFFYMLPVAFSWMSSIMIASASSMMLRRGISEEEGEQQVNTRGRDNCKYNSLEDLEYFFLYSNHSNRK